MINFLMGVGSTLAKLEIVCWLKWLLVWPICHNSQHFYIIYSYISMPINSRMKCCIRYDALCKQCVISYITASAMRGLY